MCSQQMKRGQKGQETNTFIKQSTKYIQGQDPQNTTLHQNAELYITKAHRLTNYICNQKSKFSRFPIKHSMYHETTNKPK